MFIVCNLHSWVLDLRALSKGQNCAARPWPDQSFWQWKRLFPRVFAENHLLRVYYLRFDWCDRIVLKWNSHYDGNGLAGQFSVLSYENCTHIKLTFIPCYIFSSSVLSHKHWKSIEKGSSAYDLEPPHLATKGTLNVSKVNWKHVIFFPFVRWFWSIVQKMTPLQRQQLLYFCTGSAVLPALSDRRDPEQGIVFIPFTVFEKINMLLLLLYSFVAMLNKCSFRL